MWWKALAALFASDAIWQTLRGVVDIVKDKTMKKPGYIYLYANDEKDVPNLANQFTSRGYVLVSVENVIPKNGSKKLLQITLRQHEVVSTAEIKNKAEV